MHLLLVQGLIERKRTAVIIEEECTATANLNKNLIQRIQNVLIRA